MWKDEGAAMSYGTGWVQSALVQVPQNWGQGRLSHRGPKALQFMWHSVPKGNNDIGPCSLARSCIVMRGVWKDDTKIIEEERQIAWRHCDTGKIHVHKKRRLRRQSHWEKFFVTSCLHDKTFQLIWFVSKARETAYWKPANGIVCYCEKIFNTCTGSDDNWQHFVK